MLASKTSPEDQFLILSRHATIVPEADFKSRLAHGKALRVKLGVDPTAGDIHLGWAVVLRKLREFQDLGHTAVLIIGDFTTRVGDPSGANKTRPMLSVAEINQHVDSVLRQFKLILSSENLEVRRNSEWLEPLGTAGLLKLARHATVAQVLKRDDFAKRFQADEPVTLMELCYPLLQGYDSVAVQADVELGGTDQTFNLLVGRDMQTAHGQQPQAILTMPILEGTDGTEKMSQSKANYIGIAFEPDDMFGKIMSIPDEAMEKYWTLASNLDAPGVAKIMKAGIRPEVAKRDLAENIVSIYHGDVRAQQAREAFDSTFRRHEIPTEVETQAIPAECVDEGSVYVPGLLRELGLAPSGSEGRRLLGQGAVRIDGLPLSAETVGIESLKGKTISVGRRRFVRLA